MCKYSIRKYHSREDKETRLQLHRTLNNCLKSAYCCPTVRIWSSSSYEQFFRSTARLVIQNRRPCTLWSGRWIEQWKTIWSAVCFSGPHSKAADGAIYPHFCKQERKRPIPVRRRLRRTHAVLGMTIPGGWGQGRSPEFCSGGPVTDVVRFQTLAICTKIILM